MYHKMIDLSTSLKALAVSIIYAVTVPGFFSILVSLAAFFYFTAMLYHKIVLVHYEGSWWAFIKTVLEPFRPKKSWWNFIKNSIRSKLKTKD